jgi:hypothetical protein
VLLLAAGCTVGGDTKEPLGESRAALSVTWTDVVGATASGNSLTKTAATGWNAGAASNETLAGDGNAQFTTAEANTDKMVGLSHADPATNQFAIDFAFYLSSGGDVDVYEDGTFAGNFGSYAANDTFQIQVAGTKVSYIHNGALAYRSTKTPTLPLLVGVALFTTGATVNNVTLNTPSASFWQDAVGVTTSGASLTKTGTTGWNAGAATVGTLSGEGYATFTTAEANTDKMAGLSHTDPAQNQFAIDFALYLSSGGDVDVYEDGTFAGNFGSYVAGDMFQLQVVGTKVTYLKNGTLLYTSTKTPTSPLLFGAALFTTGATVNNVVLAPFWQDAVGVTTSGMSMTKPGTGTAGWNAGAASTQTLTGNGNVSFTTAEANTDKMAGLSHADPAQNQFAIDFALYLSSGGDVDVYEDGTFAGNFGSYVAGDVFDIQVSGTQVTYLKNGTGLYTSAKAPTLPLLFGTSLFSPGATVNNVAFSAGSGTPGFWQDAVGVTTSGPSVTKTAATAFGNAGAATVSTLSGNGYVSFTTAENTLTKVAGLAHTDPRANFAAIDFGVYLSGGGGVAVYESGSQIGVFGTYVAGDVFQIQVAGSLVLYLQNGNVLYTSTKTPTLPLLFSATPYSQGATVNTVTFSSSSVVTWTKDASPIFQAKCGGCHPPAGGNGFPTVYADTQKPPNASVTACSGVTTVGACTLIRIKNGQMPAGGGCTGNPTTDAGNSHCLNQSQQNILQAWITGGQLQ